MPQLTQLPYVFWSQLFWLAVAFGFTFFVIGRGMVPKIQGTVDLRETKISEDLERAQAARREADETEAAWRSRMDAARADAMRLTQEAKAESGRETEVRAKAAAEKLNGQIESAEARIREAAASARSEIETVAADATSELVQRLTGIAVNIDDAAAAVKAVMHG
jgi:F-type H+-transporting ATPase subunit b